MHHTAIAKTTLSDHFLKSEKDSLQKDSTKYKGDTYHNSAYPSHPMFTNTASGSDFNTIYDIFLTSERDSFYTDHYDNDSCSLGDIEDTIEVSSHLREHVTDYQLDYTPCDIVKNIYV